VDAATLVRKPVSKSIEILRLSPAELTEIQAAVQSPLHRQILEAREERLVISPYPLRQSFRAVASALRTRLYHGTGPASPPVEDFPSGTLRGRRCVPRRHAERDAVTHGVHSLGRCSVAGSSTSRCVCRARENVMVALRLRTTHRNAGTVPSRHASSTAWSRIFSGSCQPSRLAHSACKTRLLDPDSRCRRRFTGTLRDYGRCATSPSLTYCAMETSQIGRYLWPADDARGNAPLFLGAPRDAAGQPTEHLIFRNVCVTAPVGTGKTTSIFRPWAVAAARAGFSTLLFDAKGDLAQDLREPIFAAGSRVVIFSTSPEQRSVY